MESPLQTLLRENPTAAVVTLPGSGSSGYDPSTTYDMPDDDDPQDATICMFRKVTEEALLAHYEAEASFDLDDFPSQASAENCSVTIEGVTYVVYKVRKRMWEGAQNGWTLLLTK